MPKIMLPWVKLTLFLTYIIIVTGATVRVTGSGMSCPDWPLCYGQLIPFPAPEGAGYTNFQVFLEWVHRLLVSIVGFLMIGLGVMAVKVRKVRPSVLRWTLTSFALLAVQIKLGAITVWFSNIHWSVALHLGTAMLFFGSVIVVKRLVAQGENMNRGTFDVPVRAKVMTWVVFVAVFLTMIMGAMVSSAYAGGSCGGLFSCMGNWMPSEDFQQLIHMKHRYLALLTFFLVGVYFSMVKNIHPELKKSAKAFKVFLLGQIILGVLTLYSFSHYADYYMHLSVAHLAWGTLFFMATVGTLGKIYYGAAGGSHYKEADHA
ncbi:MAG: COX15/CtaA family protein [Alphaproteobacteria bacterium]|nr:COX15/CtaA family protein [Alphaproteobacteria bacterium]